MARCSGQVIFSGKLCNILLVGRGGNVWSESDLLRLWF